MLTCVEIANRYCARPSWISCATRASFLCDRSAEFGLADRAPDPDEQDAVGEHAEKVARQQVLARAALRDHVVEVCEHDERERQGEPVVEVAPVPAEAQPEPDHRHECQGREQRVGDDDGAGIEQRLFR